MNGIESEKLPWQCSQCPTVDFCKDKERCWLPDEMELDTFGDDQIGEVPVTENIEDQDLFDFLKAVIKS